MGGGKRLHSIRNRTDRFSANPSARQSAPPCWKIRKFDLTKKKRENISIWKFRLPERVGGLDEQGFRWCHQDDWFLHPELSTFPAWREYAVQLKAVGLCRCRNCQCGRRSRRPHNLMIKYSHHSPKVAQHFRWISLNLPLSVARSKWHKSPATPKISRWWQSFCSFKNIRAHNVCNWVLFTWR